MSRLFKTLLLQALLFGVLGPILFWAELYFMGDAAVQQAFPIVVLAGSYFAYSLLNLAVFGRIIKDASSRTMLLYYFGSKALCLFLSVTGFTAYAMLVHHNLLAFAVNLLVFYFASVIVQTVYCVRMEKHYKGEHAKC